MLDTDTVASMSRSKKPRKPKQQRPHHDIRWWTADDALRIKTRLIDWYRTAEGVKGTYVSTTVVFGNRSPDADNPDRDLWDYAAQAATDTADRLTDTDLIWCDPHMVDLLAAAADSYPRQAPIEQHNLLAPDGFVIFAKPLPSTYLNADTKQVNDTTISAITWLTVEGSTGDPALAIEAWSRNPNPSIPIRCIESRIIIRYTELASDGAAIGHFGLPRDSHDGPAGTIEILLALAALCRSPHTRDEQTAASKAARQRAARSGVDDTKIRRIYLRKPELAANELDAARAERAGQRGHWVRGHWKDQWYPSVEEHRTIFIEGYPRGDFTRGEVTGPKVLVASDRPGRASDSGPAPGDRNGVPS